MESKKALPLQSFSERDTAKLRTLKRIATIEVVQETSLSVLNEGRYGNKSSLAIFHPKEKQRYERSGVYETIESAGHHARKGSEGYLLRESNNK